jgi:hypothetical protein
MSAEDLSTKPSNSKSGTIAPFVAKTAIVTVACFIFFALAINYVTKVVDDRVAQIRFVIEKVQGGKIGSHGLVTKFSDVLENLTEERSDLSEAAKQKIIADIRVVSDRWRPFVKQAYAAITGESEKQASQ